MRSHVRFVVSSLEYNPFLGNGKSIPIMDEKLRLLKMEITIFGIPPIYTDTEWNISENHYGNFGLLDGRVLLGLDNKKRGKHL